MLKIQSGQFINIQTMQGYDNMGQPEVQVTVEGNLELSNMLSDVTRMKLQIQEILDLKAEEARLINENPALKDVHDKYQIVYELVKKADTSTSGK